MSYPSVNTILAKQNLNLETASVQQMREALWEALQTDLTLGVEYLTKLSQTNPEAEKVTGEDIDPNSVLGKQIIRIVGCDLPRSVIQEKLGVNIGLYNCCKAEIWRGKQPDLDIRLQLKAQLTADC